MRPSDADIAAAKAAAAAVGRGVSLLDFEEHDVAVLVRDLTGEEFAEWMDVVASSKVNGSSYLLAKTLLWPTIDAARAALPAAAEEVSAFVLERAGAITQAFAEPVTLATLKAAGVPEDAALLDAHSGKKRGCVLRAPSAGVSMVLRRPSVESYDATRDGDDEVKASGVGRFAVALHLARDVVAWSNEPLDVMLDRVPGIVLDIKREALKLGGAAARRSVKSL